ncbi:MAG: hypothetical protein FIB06_06060 [Betaproteobacteria bacterium]|nr:hypothetical protein [Betaproteobacteria bacterium]
MSARRLLYLTAHHLSAYLWRQGRLEHEGDFEASPESLARFSDYLAGHRHSIYRLLVNTAEEELVVEVIPHVQGSDRKGLLERKRAQHFPGHVLTTAVSLGTERGARRNERVLLGALTNAAHIDPWLECLRAADAALAGIHSVAQMAGILLRRLGRKPAQAMLLTWQDHTLRESFVVDGQAVFSRQTPLADTSVAGLASRFAAEAARLQQYLAGQRMVQKHAPLPAIVLAHPRALPAIRDACKSHGNLAFEFIDCHEAARRLKLQDMPSSSNVELIYLHLLATAPPRAQFAPEAQRRDYFIARNRKGLLALGGVALIGGLLFTARNLIELRQLEEETSELTAREGELSWRYREITATFPQLDIDNATLRRLTDRHNELLRRQRLPDRAFILVSHALDDAPNIQLDAIDWSLGAPATASMPPGAPRAGDDGRETIVVRGTVRHGPASTARQTLATFEHFVDLLRVDRNNDVSVRKQPLDIEPGRALRSGELDESKQTRDFVVAVTRKAAP